jgi:hypothetical protein
MHFMNGRNQKRIAVRSWARNLMGKGERSSKYTGEVRCEDVDLIKLF